MRARYEFSFHSMATEDAAGHGDASLALMGSFGWEIRGIAPAPNGGYVVALQRPLDEALPLPDAPTLAATLEEPLAMPTAAELEEH
ncbi:MAG: hypothetical protein NVS2B3_17100 [Vulcanimicrobiaceae bacterium]